MRDKNIFNYQKRREIIHSPTRLLLFIIFSIIVSNILVLILSKAILSLTLWGELLVDSALVAIILFPSLYFLVFLPQTRILAERKLTHEEILNLHAAVESSGEAIFMTDLDGLITYVNLEFTNLYGYTPGEVIGKTTPRILKSGVMPQDDYKKFWDTILNKEVLRCEFINKAKDGRLITVEGSATPVLSDNNVIIRFIAIQHDITRRKKTEENLAQEHYLTDTLLNNIPDHIYFKDLESRFIRINKAHAQSLGLSDPGQATGKTDFDFHTPEHAKQAFQDEQMIIQTGQTISKEEKLVRADEHNQWVYITKLPLLDKERKIIGTFGISRDVTARKQAEDAFRKLSLRHEAILAAVPEIIMEVDNNKIYKWANRSGLEFFGNDVIGKDASLYFEGEQDTYNQVKPLFYGSDDIFYVESWQRRHDGEKRLLAWWCRVIKDTDGNVTGALSSARDITERKNLENAILFKQLLLETIIENIPDQVYYKDRDSKFVLCNTPVAILAGCNSEKDLIGKSDFDFHPLQLAQQYFNDEQALMDKGQKFLNHEEKIINKITGEQRWNLSSKVPVKDAKGKVIGLAGINHDITERKLAEEEIKLKNEQLQIVNAEKDKFLSIIAHDLRGPLSAFVAATQILTEDIANMSPEEVSEIILAMKNGSENVYSLLENLLEWSRLQRGMMEFKLERINLKHSILHVIPVVESSAREKEITIDIDLNENLIIKADMHMFETIIRNIVSNAIKFTPVRRKIFISAFEAKDDNIVIKVRDEGIGIPSSLLNKLFKLNEKTNRPGTEGEPSTGLGLPLCREFIEKHGGRIWVESEEGKGSTFSFTIPNA